MAKNTTTTTKASTSKATSNLTTKQITTWKNNVDNAITKNLVPSLNKAYDDAIQLEKVTSTGEDSNNLNYRFKDLSKVANQASQQLTTFMKSFDTDLTTYIATVEKAEKTTAEKMKKSIDQFSELASKISSLKM